MLLLHVYILLICLLHNIVYNVLSHNKNSFYKIVVTKTRIIIKSRCLVFSVTTQVPTTKNNPRPSLNHTEDSGIVYNCLDS